MAEKKESKIHISEQSPLKWADGQERTLIDRRMAKNGWKKTFRQYLERLARQLEKLKIDEATISFNAAPTDRQDPGVALYFSKPRKEDYSWRGESRAVANQFPDEKEQMMKAAYRNSSPAKSDHSHCRRPLQSLPRLALEQHAVPQPVRFNAAFIERRMREHRAWQETREYEMASEIVREVEGAIVRKLEIARAAAEQLEVAQ